MPAVPDEIAYAVADIGGRARMEDTHVLEVESTDPLRVLGGVFDGHDGIDVACLAAQRLPGLFRGFHSRGAEIAFRKAYAAIQGESEDLPGGAVAATLYLEGKSLTVANCGDAHIVHVSGKKARQLTEDHRLTNDTERRRVVDAGAKIWGPYVCLPDGSGIMPTRTLGDHAFRKVGVLAEPAVSTHSAEPGWIVAACDGLWDVMTADEVPLLLKGASTAKMAATRLVHEALRVRATTDNLTVLVVRIPERR